MVETNPTEDSPMHHKDGAEVKLAEPALVPQVPVQP